MRASVTEGHRDSPRTSPASTGHKRPTIRPAKRDAFAMDVDRLRAEEHFLAMESRTRCSLPREHVVCVKDLYPEADVNYHPACTLLHRCDSSSGCCRNPSESCQGHDSESVILYFRTNRDAEVLKIPFINYTSCRCQPKLEDIVYAASTTTPQPVDEDDYDGVDERGDSQDNLIDECPRCPKPFSKRLMQGKCTCDCFDSDDACLAIRRGRKGLAEIERRCVKQRVCQKPRCDHGSHFDVVFGECRTPVADDDDEYLDEDDESDSNERQRHHRTDDGGDPRRRTHNRNDDSDSD